MRLRTGKEIVTHKCRSGRTGGAWSKRQKGILEKVRKEMKRFNSQERLQVSRIYE